MYFFFSLPSTNRRNFYHNIVKRVAEPRLLLGNGQKVGTDFQGGKIDLLVINNKNGT